MPVRAECLQCGRVYEVTDAGFHCDHTEEFVVGDRWTTEAATNFCMKLEGTRIRDNAIVEIRWLEDLFKAA
jgi:hypothetical protein